MAMVPLPVPVPLITSGAFTAAVVRGADGAPASVVREADGWSVAASWRLEGPIVPLLDGCWRLQVTLEPIGHMGVAAVAPVVLVDHVAGMADGSAPDRRASFSASVPFVAGTPPLDGAPDAAFHATATLTYLTRDGVPGPVAAAVDLGIVEVIAG